MFASLYMIFSAFLYSLQNVCAQYSGDMFGFWTACLIRGVVGVLVCLCLMEKYVSSIMSENGKFLFLRSVLGGATILLSFYSIGKCGITTTTAITSTSSLWTAMMGNFMMPDKYKWSCLDIFLVSWCLSGIVLLSIERNGHVSYHCWAAIFSALCQAGVNLTIKHLDKEPAMVVAFWGMMGSIMMGLPGFLWEWMGKHIHNVRYQYDVDARGMMSLFATGVLSLFAQYYKTLSIQNANLSVLIWRHLDVVFSIIWDYFLFHQLLVWYKMMGVLMILAGCGMKMVLETRNKEKQLVLPTTTLSRPLEGAVAST